MLDAEVYFGVKSTSTHGFDTAIVEIGRDQSDGCLWNDFAIPMQKVAHLR
jgi:hypothetical protein